MTSADAGGALCGAANCEVGRFADPVINTFLERCSQAIDGLEIPSTCWQGIHATSLDATISQFRSSQPYQRTAKPPLKRERWAAGFRQRVAHIEGPHPAAKLYPNLLLRTKQRQVAAGEFKARVVQASQQPGVSMTAVPMAHGIVDLVILDKIANVCP